MRLRRAIAAGRSEPVHVRYRGFRPLFGDLRGRRVSTVVLGVAFLTAARASCSRGRSLALAHTEDPASGWASRSAGACLGVGRRRCDPVSSTTGPRDPLAARRVHGDLRRRRRRAVEHCSVAARRSAERSPERPSAGPSAPGAVPISAGSIGRRRSRLRRSRRASSALGSGSRRTPTIQGRASIDRRSRADIFLVPACCSSSHRSVIPTIRTIYLSLLDKRLQGVRRARRTTTTRSPTRTAGTRTNWTNMFTSRLFFIGIVAARHRRRSSAWS